MVTKLKDTDLLKELERRGYSSVKTNIPTDLTFSLPKPKAPFEIGIVSDTHLCSKHQQLTWLNDFYKYCASRNIKEIIHAGDISQGSSRMHLGSEYELFIHSYNAQVDYIVNVYPKVKGITTRVLGGNHDFDWWKRSGADIVKAIARRRKDIKYMGFDYATIKMGGISIGVIHPGGGVAYARSYRLQKMIEQISPQQKPNILISGHYHCACHLPMYRNVEAFMVGCFQSQTPYLRRKALYPTVCGLILRIEHNRKGITALNTYWKLYHDTIEHDY